MNFYDDEIKGYTISFAGNPEAEGFRSKVRFTPANTSTSERFVDAVYETNARFVLRFLNRESLLGVTFRNDVSQAQQARFCKHLPTEAEEQRLRILVDGILVGENRTTAEAFVSAGAYCYKDCVEAGMVDIDGRRVLEFNHSFDRVYDVFLCECFEILRSGQRIAKCRQCGKYYYPQTNHSTRYCSEKCRMLANRPATPVDEAFSKAYNTKNRYRGRHKEDAAVQSRFHKWRQEAETARVKYERGEIDWQECCRIFDLNIKGGDDE